MKARTKSILRIRWPKGSLPAAQSSGRVKALLRSTIVCRLLTLQSRKRERRGSAACELLEVWGGLCMPQFRSFCSKQGRRELGQEPFAASHEGGGGDEGAKLCEGDGGELADELFTASYEVGGGVEGHEVFTALSEVGGGDPLSSWYEVGRGGEGDAVFPESHEEEGGELRNEPTVSLEEGRVAGGHELPAASWEVGVRGEVRGGGGGGARELFGASCGVGRGGGVRLV